MSFSIWHGDVHVDGTITAERFDIPFKDTFRFRATTVTVSREIDEVHNVYLVDTSDGDKVITLPLSVPFCDRAVWVKKIALDNDLIIQPQGGELIDGDTVCTIGRQYVSLTLLSDGTQWWII